MDKLLFKLSQIGYALNCTVAFTNRNLEILPQDNETLNNLIKNLKEGDSVFISQHETTFDFNVLVTILQSKNIKVDFYLMGEPTIREDLFNLLLPYANEMFLNNNTYDYPNVHNMPIGIRDCEKVVPNHKGFSHDFLFEEGNKQIDKEHLCMLCFSFTHGDRFSCYYELKDKPFVLNLNDNEYEKQISIHCGKVPVWINYEYTHKSHYVLSPSGCGEATHRFFEAIYLDTIPIVKKTNKVFDKLYNVFPCLVVNDWSEVTEELLLSNMEIYKNKIKDFKNAYPNAFTDIDSIKDLLLLT
jgi:hypothetical protein